nr:RNA-directed DNA polymerase, eukaryota, reverse transcriptase zinc-binding domain protein [Tanacetum cinerariifolium]
SLWVKWVNIVKLRGKSIWEIEEENQDSCTWKVIIGLRDKVRKHIIHKIGNGRSTSIWHDNWNDMGQLSQIISYRDIYDARLQNSNTVADLIEEGVEMARDLV